MASKALDDLDRADGKDGEEKEKTEGNGDDNEEEVEDIISPGASRIGPLASENERRKEDRARIRTKVLMRRAKARTETGGWSALAGAEEGSFSFRQI